MIIMKLKNMAALLLSGVMALSFAACGSSKIAPSNVHSVEDLDGKTVGVQTGTTGDLYISDDASLPNVKVERFSTGFEAVTALKQGKIDMLIVHHNDLETDEDIILSENLTQCCAFALYHDKDNHIDEVNRWLEVYTQSEEFIKMQDLFTRPNNPVRLAERGVKRDTLCPYDELLKRYAKDLGWDWRMLAAVVYQESKFSISSHSHRGATGLMQVMPRTARYYHIHDLHDPEQNLLAGTSHLKRLQKLYRGSGMSQQERINFTLAAYNAGEGRIMDCRNLAKSQNLDHTRWEDVVKVIPQMSQDSILVDENVRLGKFKGTETISYVENVMNLYHAICKICPEHD